MTLPTGKPPATSVKPGIRLGFTLVELILVMALLVIVIGLAAPSLSRFFHGRALDNEASRFVALTRYAQSQAVSLGTPLILWIDPQEGAYALRDEMGFNTSRNSSSVLPNTSPSRDSGNEQRIYQLAKDLSFEINRRHQLTNGVATIRFVPDGTIDEASLPFLVIRGKEEESVAIMQSRNRLRYEITANTNQWDLAYP